MPEVAQLGRAIAVYWPQALVELVAGDARGVAHRKVVLGLVEAGAHLKGTHTMAQIGYVIGGVKGHVCRRLVKYQQVEAAKQITVQNGFVRRDSHKTAGLLP